MSEVGERKAAAKALSSSVNTAMEPEVASQLEKRKRGRPRKIVPDTVAAKPAGKRGRPRKHLVSPLGNFGIAALFGGKPVRKTRANAGGKRVKKQPVKRMLMF